MKRSYQLFALFFLITTASTAIGADQIPVTTITEPPAVVLATELLTVTIDGRGTVTSNPASIDCTSDGITQTGDCEAYFVIDTVVALLATAPAADENASYHFLTWNEDDTNNTEVYGVLMAAPKSVSAQFGALGIPVLPPFPVPTSNEIYGPYVPVNEAFLSGIAEELKPIAIVERSDGGFDINVGLPPFGDGLGGGIDVYAAVSIDDLNDAMFLINSVGAPVPFASGLVPWKTNVDSQEIDETLLSLPGAITPFLPASFYHVHLVITPTGSTTFSYYWSTYFELVHFMINPFFLAP